MDKNSQPDSSTKNKNKYSKSLSLDWTQAEAEDREEPREEINVPPSQMTSKVFPGIKNPCIYEMLHINNQFHYIMNNKLKVVKCQLPIKMTGKLKTTLNQEPQMSEKMMEEYTQSSKEK